MRTGQAVGGLRYAVRRSSSQVGYCSLSVKCGTRDEDGFHSGLAHFVEHTIFKGTSKKSWAVINSYLDKLGGELNAYTTKEEIVFHATVLKEDLRKAASLLFELVTSPTFPEKLIEIEKTVVIDEINSYKDTPADDIYDRFEELLFTGHPLSGPILGTVSSVKKISREELLRFVGSNFTPDRMAFTVVCDEDETRLEKMVSALASRYFPAASVPPLEICADHSGKESISSGPDAQDGSAAVFVPKPFDKTVGKRNHQVNCVIGNVAPSLYGGKERVAAILLSNILGGPATNSILNARLREKNGWVYGVECSYTQYADTGIMAICFGCERENLDKCLKVIYEETARLASEPLSPARLKAARKQLLGQLAVSGDNGEAQCLSMGKSLLAYGEVPDSAHNRQLVESVSAEDIVSAAAAVFSPDKISKLVFL